MKKAKSSGKNKSSFNLRRRKINFGASVHMMPNNSELQSAYYVSNPKNEKPKINNDLYPHTSDGALLSRPVYNQGKFLKKLENFPFFEIINSIFIKIIEIFKIMS